jgi:hypothetical protein
MTKVLLAILAASVCLAAGLTVAHAQAGRKLSGPEIRATLTGRTAIQERNEYVADSETNSRILRSKYPIRFYTEYRNDGSLAFRCFNVEPTGESPCRTTAKLVGVWEIRGDQSARRL